MSFDKAFEHTVGLEGGYSDHASDRGGKTMWGITESVARKAGYGGPMNRLPIDVAKAIYRKSYWDALKLDDVDLMSEEIAHELFDTAVNMGTGRAGKFLQRTLNALNRNLFSPLIVDGKVGDMTVDALRAFLSKRGRVGSSVVLKILNGLQCEHYVQIVEADPSQRDFIYGWVANRVS